MASRREKKAGKTKNKLKRRDRQRHTTIKPRGRPIERLEKLEIGNRETSETQTNINNNNSNKLNMTKLYNELIYKTYSYNLK